MHIKLRDGSFAGCDSARFIHGKPRYFQWQRLGPHDWPMAADTVIYTDAGLARALSDRTATKIAWILEPPSINLVPYAFVRDHRREFAAVFTHQEWFISEPTDYWYPFGGSHLRPPDWLVYPKSKDISIIASSKRVTIGHQMRHSVIKILGDKVDAFGPEYVPLGDYALPAYAPYRFQVVIENERSVSFFTEKLIDCFLTGTIPIYCGCPSYLIALCEQGAVDPAGIIAVENLGEIYDAVDMVRMDPEGIYEHYRSAAEYNWIAAREFVCVEDWLAVHYGSKVLRVDPAAEPV